MHKALILFCKGRKDRWEYAQDRRAETGICISIFFMLGLNQRRLGLSFLGFYLFIHFFAMNIWSSRI